MSDPAELLREVRETGDWLLALPEKLVAAVLGPVVVYYERKQRIRTLKELVELREIAKALETLFIYKGDFLAFARSVDTLQRLEDVRWVKEIFREVHNELGDVLEMIRDASFSDTALVIEAIAVITSARRAYGLLAQAPDAQLLHTRQLGAICTQAYFLAEAGHALVRRLDEHRRQLDHTYG